MGYDFRADRPGPGEYMVAVYTWAVGELVSTPCRHRHRIVSAAIWCKDFPKAEQPNEVVVVDARSGRVKRSVRPK